MELITVSRPEIAQLLGNCCSILERRSPLTRGTDLEGDPVGVGQLEAEGQLGQRQHQQHFHGSDSVHIIITGQI